MAFDATELEDGLGTNYATAIVYTVSGSSDPVALAEAYLDRRGRTTLSGLGTDALKEAALVNGTEFVEFLARGLMPGTPRYGADQRLLLPRSYDATNHQNLVTANAIPRLYLEATWEASELAAGNAALHHETPRNDPNLRRKKVGPLESEWWQSPSTVKYREAIENMIDPFLLQVGSLRR